MKALFFLALATALAGRCTLAQPLAAPSASANGEVWNRFLVSNSVLNDQVLANVKEELTSRGGWISTQPPELPRLGTQDPIEYLREQETKAPTRPGDWLYERFHWRLSFQAVLLSEQLMHSPIASERRQGIAVAFWLMQLPFLNLHAHQMPAQIADCLVLPVLSSASDEPMAFLSRLQLLRVVADVYDRANREFDADNALRAVIAVADPVRLNLADGARYQLAFRLHDRGYIAPALALLSQISHDALRPGAQKVVAQWRHSSNS